MQIVPFKFWKQVTFSSLNQHRTLKSKPASVSITSHPVLLQHQMHLWGLQTPQKQNPVDSWRPRHFLKGHSTRKLFPNQSYFHCFQDSRRKPCSQGDSPEEKQDLTGTMTKSDMKQTEVFFVSAAVVVCEIFFLRVSWHKKNSKKILLIFLWV